MNTLPDRLLAAASHFRAYKIAEDDPGANRPVLDFAQLAKTCDEAAAALSGRGRGYNRGFSDGQDHMREVLLGSEDTTPQPGDGVVDARREAVDRAVRKARTFYFRHNPANTLLANEFNEILLANGTFEPDTEKHDAREQAAAPSAKGVAP